MTANTTATDICTCGGPLAPTDPTHPADNFCVRCAATYRNGSRIHLARASVATTANAAVRDAHHAKEK